MRRLAITVLLLAGCQDAKGPTFEQDSIACHEAGKRALAQVHNFCGTEAELLLDNVLRSEPSCLRVFGADAAVHMKCDPVKDGGGS